MHCSEQTTECGVIHLGELKIFSEPNQNLVVAALWFSIGFAVASSAIVILLGTAPFLSPALLMLSALPFMLGAQRTHRYAIEPAKFIKRMQCVGFSTAILTCLSNVFNSAVQ